MADPSTIFPPAPVWESSGTSRIPFSVYTSEQLHQRELERFFYKAHWSYVALEAEIPTTVRLKSPGLGISASSAT